MLPSSLSQRPTRAVFGHPYRPNWDQGLFVARGDELLPHHAVLRVTRVVFGNLRQINQDRYYVVSITTSSIACYPNQCSQRSRGPTGPGGRTAKSPGPDGTAENMPSSSAKSKDGRLWGGRRARQSETPICREAAGLLWEL